VYPWVHQLDILEVMAQCRGGHKTVSLGSKYCLDGSISIVSLLVPSLLVSGSPSRVEVLKHVFHSIGCQEVCYLAGPQIRGCGIQIHIQISHEHRGASVLESIEGSLNMMKILQIIRGGRLRSLVASRRHASNGMTDNWGHGSGRTQYLDWASLGLSLPPLSTRLLPLLGVWSWQLLPRLCNLYRGEYGHNVPVRTDRSQGL